MMKERMALGSLVFLTGILASGCDKEESLSFSNCNTNDKPQSETVYLRKNAVDSNITYDINGNKFSKDGSAVRIEMQDGEDLKIDGNDGITFQNEFDGRRYEMDFTNRGNYIKVDILTTCP